MQHSKSEAYNKTSENGDSNPMKNVQLPPELTEQILTKLVDDYNDDPAKQWALRHLSRHQKRRIEQRFCNFWLPKLIITLYAGGWTSIDYEFAGLETLSSTPDSDPKASGVAHFRISEDANSRASRESSYVVDLWKEHSVENPNAHLRLGEKFLNYGFKGGYIINDTELPDLQVDECGFNIRFNWREAFTALLREEIMLREIHDKMVTEKTAKWKLDNDWPESKAIPDDVHMMFLCKDIQMGRRVVIREHRFRRYDPTGQITAPFHELSKHLHRQKPTRKDGMPNGRCACCSRKAGPDIFEVISQEESMVPLFPSWKSLNFETLRHLYAEEFGWQCYLVQGSASTDVQKNRARQWKARTELIESLKGNDRWDILG